VHIRVVRISAFGKHGECLESLAVHTFRADLKGHNDARHSSGKYPFTVLLFLDSRFVVDFSTFRSYESKKVSGRFPDVSPLIPVSSLRGGAALVGYRVVFESEKNDDVGRYV